MYNEIQKITFKTILSNSKLLITWRFRTSIAFHDRQRGSTFNPPSLKTIRILVIYYSKSNDWKWKIRTL